MAKHWTKQERRKFGHAFVDEFKAGSSVAEICFKHQASPYLVRSAMMSVGFYEAETVSVTQRSAKPEVVQCPAKTKRPPWTYPDAITRRIVKEAREEMERNGK